VSSRRELGLLGVKGCWKQHEKSNLKNHTNSCPPIKSYILYFWWGIGIILVAKLKRTPPLPPLREEAPAEQWIKYYPLA
jgi:hypothetical protein